MDEVTLMTGTQFARAVGVTRQRVSQWKAEGKISAAALEGEGRGALINPVKAKEDLLRTLSPSQRLGLNGLKTRLEALGVGEVEPPAAAPRGETFDDRLKAEKLREIELRNRAAAKREAEEAGLYVRASHHRKAVATTAAVILRGFETAIPEMANGLAEKLGVPLRDVTRELGGQLRLARAKIEADLRRSADREPDLVEDELLSDHEPVQGEA
ncbi:hypothetical protein ATO13_08566 [Stappia sp. 22II-S9-Z10]|nr:hypothetical protein ATO13_08566 [Stappia sp. 22II-S9-Z10]